MTRTMKTLLAVAALLQFAGCGREVKSVVVEPPRIDFRSLTQSEKLVVKATDIIDAPVEGVEFTFNSENNLVATVDANGVVKPTGNGSTWIRARTNTGVEGDTFVTVCLPKELKCDPPDRLELKVGLAAPIKCRILDCNDEPRPGRIELSQADDELLLKEGENIFIGLAVGESEVEVEGLGLATKIEVRIDEQDYLPGMGPGSGGGGGRGGGKKAGGDSAYGSSAYDHILKNMRFGGD